MTVDHLAAALQSAAGPASTTDTKAGAAPADVLIVATVLTSSEAIHLVDLNGAQYEIAAGDVIDIEYPALGPVAAEAPPPESEQPPAKEQVDTEPTEERADKPASTQEPRLAFIKINPNAVLTRRIEVPAVLVAAAGTWLTVVPSTDQAA
ncbi:hypothetical protein HNR60_001409 [Rhodopseudomonas rhenobacensis]|uniref:Uncharacterized protein n=1 Tax=Rhodopseudomonas rhenobacensis TaxID=87461 RepID=A0A7W7Z281_9BRAD|nr:hypothetical protein [Rhodopseudomonas rhenobacensis]MBB5046661.1 hypothetical protein [Rhodopseudomonas rhenobacensis]